MVSFSVRHVSDTALSEGRVLPSRRKGAASGCVVATRRHYGIATSYQIDEQNGSALITVPVVFPDAKYAALDYTPARTGYRFLGWYDAASGGGAVSVSDQVRYGISPIYARWQDHVTVTFDATTNGGAMPQGWTAPYYFAGQEYGILPTPTHPTLNFGGWYLNGVRVTSASIVPAEGATLVAQYVASSFSVDLNDEWRLQSPNSNPDDGAYDGVYESFSNWNYEDQENWSDTMAKMYINVVGYTSFRILIASNSEGGYDYVVAMEPDIDPEYVPHDNEWDEPSEGVKASTSMGYNSADPSVIGDYKVVDYELDGGSHRICVLYRKDGGYSEGDDRGYLLIPYVQGGGS